MTPPYDLSIPGWMDESELQWLFDTASQMSSVVEIGCYQGRSTFALLQGCKGPVYAVDTWQDIMGNGERPHALFMQNLESRIGFERVWNQLRTCAMKSADAAKAFDAVPFLMTGLDMVFVDGDHLEAAVALDLELWTPKARKLIAGHDYHNPTWPDVTTVVDRVFGSRVQNPTGMIWAVEVLP